MSFRPAHAAGALAGAFLSTLKAGSIIGAAIAAGFDASPQFNSAEALATLIGANIAVVLGGG